MRITHSPGVDALSIRLHGGAGKKVGTREIAPGVYADCDEEDRFIGLEVLNASLHCDRAELEQLASPEVFLTLAEAWPGARKAERSRSATSS
jgi:uncharacterized protein YuzE